MANSAFQRYVLGTDTSDADAVASDILDGKFAYVDGDKIEGTIPTQTLSNASTTVAAGYYAATDLVTIDADLAAANIASGKTVFGIAGSALLAKLVCSLDDSFTSLTDHSWPTAPSIHVHTSVPTVSMGHA